MDWCVRSRNTRFKAVELAISKRKELSMKELYSYLTAVMMLLFVSGCVEQSPEKLYQQAQKAAADSSAYDKAEKLFQKLLARYPEDQRCDDALFTLAQIEINRGRGQKAVAKYEQLLSQYPQSELCYKAQFMIGFIYSEMLQDYPKAKQAYQKVIENYPDCDLVSSAKWMIANMGKNPEELGIFDSEKKKGSE